jgi:hypothetical protein
MKRIAIIGGGPMGMEAALYGASAGFDVRLFERGRLAENVRQWGYIGLFTEWKRSRSPLAVQMLEQRGHSLPDGESAPTGEELAHYIQTLATLDPLRGRVSPQNEVVSITRAACLKSDFLNDARRKDYPFQIVTRGIAGEKTHFFDAVIDATGVWQNPNPMGSGGAPCAGETALQKRIDYHIPDVPGRDRARFAGRHTLVIGSGHSAASTLRAVGDLFEEFPTTRLTWAVRRDVPPHGQPYTLTPEDSSPHRDALHRRANELARDARVDFRPLTVVQSVRWNQKFFVELACGTTSETIECDNIAAHTGFRPGLELWRELQVRVHPATDAVGNLADAIIEQNRRAGTGLSTGYAEKAPTPPDKWRPIAGGPELLHSGEPDFYVLGIKSYGRDAGFLMHNGLRQVRDAWQLISGDATLDLYNGALD